MDEIVAPAAQDGAEAFDPRVTPARPDLAAAHLRGRVEAEQFVEGEARRVSAEMLDLKRRPRSDASLDTQLLHGETVRVYEDEDGWAWVQADRDGYVGYVASHGLAAAGPAPSHRVVANRTFVYPAPDMKQPILGALPLDARVPCKSVTGAFAALGGIGSGYVFAAHLAPVAPRPPEDFVAVARRLIGTPYLWGGKTAQGIDCSGLVQLAASVAGRTLPRDTHMQQDRGEDVAGMPDAPDLQRGDLVFWKGHVGIMTDGSSLLHANAHHMMVVEEPFAAARDRIAAAGTDVVAVRRLRDA